TNASGSRCLKYGYTRAHVERLRIVLDNGDIADVGVETMATTAEAPTRLAEIVRGTAARPRQHDAAIRAARPAAPYNPCRFDLTGVLSDAGLNLPRLLVGSEGTLALFTEATLRTVALPGGVGVVLLGFESLEMALRASRLAEAEGPSACELLDRRLISLARSSITEAARLLPAAVECALLVEFEADSPAEAKRLAQNRVEQVHEVEKLSQVAHAAVDPAEIDLFWRLRNSALPSLYGLGHGAQPIAVIEDVGVPPDNLGAFLTRMQEVLQQHELTASFLTHAATGQVHVRPFVDLGNAEQSAKLWPL